MKRWQKIMKMVEKLFANDDNKEKEIEYIL